MVNLKSVGSGAMPKIMNGLWLGAGFTIGYILVDFAAKKLGAVQGWPAGYQGNVIPPMDQSQYNYNYQETGIYGPGDETRFAG